MTAQPSCSLKAASPALCRVRSARTAIRRRTPLTRFGRLEITRHRRRGRLLPSESPLSWSRDGWSQGSAQLVSYPLIHARMTTTALRDTVCLDFFIPVTGNDGSRFPESLFRTLERHVLDLTGGLTRRGDVEGIWRNPSSDAQCEISRAYTTTVDADVADRVAAELDLLIRSLFRQLAAFVQATPTRATAF